MRTGPRPPRRTVALDQRDAADLHTGYVGDGVPRSPAYPAARDPERGRGRRRDLRTCDASATAHPSHGDGPRTVLRGAMITPRPTSTPAPQGHRDSVRNHRESERVGEAQYRFHVARGAARRGRRMTHRIGRTRIRRPASRTPRPPNRLSFRRRARPRRPAADGDASKSACRLRWSPDDCRPLPAARARHSGWNDSPVPPPAAAAPTHLRPVRDRVPARERLPVERGEARAGSGVPRTCRREPERRHVAPSTPGTPRASGAAGRPESSRCELPPGVVDVDLAEQHEQPGNFAKCGMSKHAGSPRSAPPSPSNEGVRTAMISPVGGVAEVAQVRGCIGLSTTHTTAGRR